MVGMDSSPSGASESTSGYRRLCVLAEGGMGEVELVAREEGRFQRLYAVKRLRDSYRNEPEFHRMFLEEARIAGLLRHTHVVSVLDVGEDERGPYLLMDYVDGISVSELIRASAETGIEVPLQVALLIAMQTARGLHAAHELSDPSGQKLHLVHRDVSPQNLLVGYDGTTRVTDFGIAKAYGNTTNTATGVLKGKLGYLSPEQLRFEEPDRRSDLFSLGVVFFEMLSGRRLYKSVEGNDGPRRILNEPPPDIGEYREDAPPKLVEVLFSLLAKDPNQRPDTAAIVADQLEALWLDEVQLEGKLDLGEYLREAFAAKRDKQQGRVQEAIAEDAERLETGISIDVGPLVAEPPRRSRRWVFAGLGLGLAAVAAVAVVMSTGLASPSLVVPTLAAKTAPPPPAAPEPEPEAPEVVEVEEPVAEVEAEGIEEATPAVRRRRRRRRPPSGGESGVPRWNW